MSILNTGGLYGAATVSMSQGEYMNMKAEIAAFRSTVTRLQQQLEQAGKALEEGRWIVSRADARLAPSEVYFQRFRNALAAYDAAYPRADGANK